MIRFFHPQMIAQCANKPGPTIDQMIDFVIASLTPRGQLNNASIIRFETKHRLERAIALPTPTITKAG